MKNPGYRSDSFARRAFRSLLILSMAASACLFMCAQEPPVTPLVTTQANEPGYRLRVQTNVVIVRVIVRDSHGRAVAGLSKQDFNISDNRKVQDISGFSVETARGAAHPGLPPSAGVGPNALGMEVAVRPTAPLTFLALYFDDLNSVFDSVVRSRDAAEKFIAGLPPTERVGIFTSSGRQSLDFTDDRQKLHEVLFKLRANSRVSSKSDCMEITDYLASQATDKDDRDAYLILREQAINQCHMDPKFVTDSYLRMYANAAYGNYLVQMRVDLDSLDGVLDHLALMPGERQVMLVSDGFMTLDMHDRIEHVIDHALRARVIISALDGKGLAVLLREADASRTSLPTGFLAGIYQLFDVTQEYQETATLADIAEGTGGQFFHNNNDLLGGFRRTLTPPEVSYILAFSPQQLKNDGSFHNLKITLANGHGMKVQARKGYFAPKGRLTPAEQAIDQIRDAIFSPDMIQDLPITVQTHINRRTSLEQMEVETKLDVRGLRFKVERDRNINDVLFVIALFDRDGRYVMGNQQEIALRLKSNELADLQESGLTFRARIPVKTGGDTVRVVVREFYEGKMAAMSKSMENAQ